MTVAPIVTARLSLRPPVTSDETFYCRLYGDPELMQHIAPPLAGAAAARAFRAACRMNAETAARRRTWIVVEQAAGTPVGVIGLVIDGDGGEIGAVLLADWHSRGFIAEAITALVEHAFVAYGLAALHTRHGVENLAALGLMAKLGFARVPEHPEGEGPACRWRLLRDDWSRRRAGPAA